MFARLRNSLPLLLLAVTPILRAQAPSTQAPIPPQIASAHTIFISNGGAPSFFNAFTGGADRGYNTLYADLQQWNRYTIVPTPAQADLIFQISAMAIPTDVAGRHTDTIVYTPQLVLRITDPKTQAVLWTTTTNITALGRQKSRDKAFDRAVAVVVDQVRYLNGQQLTLAQAREVRSNSQWPTSVKVLLVSGIAVGVGVTTYGIYRVTHPPTLPALPTCTDPPFCPATAAGPSLPLGR
jgi:hypothetical protein